ncbi:probable cytochrome P450 313a4 [Sitodiplosis mosellana]|uniref:probable cytochrome P450 313a4 n=1 Tax=Sitodiplosis mosellana TaxID=263140 RepID=UPI0024451D16|nr:probable cytochrome P450 313a4 [Sitodiplosis mosellana]
MEPFLKEPGDFYRTIFIGHMDTVTKTLMGTEMNTQCDDRAEFFYQHVKTVTNAVQHRILRFWFHLELIFGWSKIGREEQRSLKECNEIIDQIYERKVNELNVMKAQGIDYLDKIKNENTANVTEKCLILEREGVFTHENALDQMRLMIIAGIDTSSITVFGTLLLLAINQKHQDAVVEELRSIFDSADCVVTHAQLANMQYLERVIKESMRLIPPIPIIGRKPSTDIDVPRGTIPKNAFVLINILHLHRNPKIWGENAIEFDPDRFLPENIAKRPPFSYIPFSGGARNCIGMKYAMISAKIVLANLLRRYKFTTHLKFEDIHLKTHVVLEVTNENALQIEERHFSTH